jgi:flagellar basal-body rod modification protein FlgD
MASVGSIIPSSNTDPTTGTNNNSSSRSSTAAGDPLANESTFLTLLVSQLKNQDPATPMDGTTFVTQLAQFSDLEQNLAMRQDLDSMSLKYDGTSSTTPASSTTASSDNSNGTSGSSATTGSQS